MISPEKITAPDNEDGKATPKATKTKGKGKGKKAATQVEEDVLPVFHTDEDAIPEGSNINADVSSVPPGPTPVTTTSDTEGNLAEMSEIPFLPTPLTPSINKTLKGISTRHDEKLPALPAGLTVATLKSRLDPKKKIK